MKLADAVTLAYQRQWSMINTFSVEIHMPPKLEIEVGQITKDHNINIVSVQTPDFTNDPIETFIANKWFIQNGKDTLYRFSITFRDYNQMYLYSKFMQIYNLTKENYFDDVALTIILYKDSDWLNEYDRPFMVFYGTLVEGVSNLSFSNDTEAQIAEFTVNFKCNQPVVL